MHRPIPPNAAAMIRALAEANDVTVDELLVMDRQRHLTAVRHRIWRELRGVVGTEGQRLYSDERIAGWFGVNRKALDMAARRLDEKTAKAG